MPNFTLIGQLFQIIKHSTCLKHKNNKIFVYCHLVKKFEETK